MIYAHLVAGADGEQRTKLDDELYAPEGGWEQANKNLLTNINQS